jgi:hypothetical protein
VTEQTEPLNFAAHVWTELSNLDVSPHIKHTEDTDNMKGAPYLPWEAAWMLLKSKYPGSSFTYGAEIRHPDGTVEVEVHIHVRCRYFDFDNQFDTDLNSLSGFCRLPVMTWRFKAITEPDARAISDARARCLVKAIAIHTGLGLQLWTDEYTSPVGKQVELIDGKELAELQRLISETGTIEADFLSWCEVDKLEDLPYSRYKSATRLLQAKAKRGAK